MQITHSSFSLNKFVPLTNIHTHAVSAALTRDLNVITDREAGNLVKFNALKRNPVVLLIRSI